MVRDTMQDTSDIWQRLTASLNPSEISWRIDSKPKQRDGRFYARFVSYVEAGTVRERLDSVVPGEWDLTLEALRECADSDGVPMQAFKARLQVLGVIREDVGQGPDYKQAATDAFKRAAVRFGIGHELYAMEQNWVEVDGDGKFAKPVEDPQTAYDRRYGSGKQSANPTSAGRSSTTSGSSNASRTTSTNTPETGAPTRTSSTTSSATDEPSCPKCGGRVWDNRATKRNPKAPDYKCRRRECDGVIWAPRGSERDENQEADDWSPGPPLADDDEIPF
jgi:hypothetical protein